MIKSLGQLIHQLLKLQLKRNIVDHSFVEVLGVVLQKHQQEEKEATANFVDCHEERNASDEKKRQWKKEDLPMKMNRVAV